MAWRSVPEEGHTHLAGFEHVEDGHVWYRATVKWDGCVDFYRTYNVPFDLHATDAEREDVDYIHICDIDHMIAMLTDLKEIALAYFDTDEFAVAGLREDELADAIERTK